jgi:DNA-binding transcriptional regulator/RsmH inhibitor MraZ
MSEIVKKEEARDSSVGVLVGSKMRNLDRQQRLTINANWRHAFGLDADGQTRVYLAPGTTADGQSCLDMIPGSVIRKRYAFLKDIAEDDPVRAQIALLFRNMEHKALDVQGRLGIPETLRQYAGIKNTVLMIGAGDCIKIMAASDEEKSVEKIDFDEFKNARIVLAKLRSELHKS